MAGPFIDPSIMLLDPQFTDRFAVVQRVQSINTYGEVSTTNSTRHNVLGIVTPAKPAELKRHDDMQFGQRTLSIITRAMLNSAAQVINVTPPTQRQPDQILWAGDTFTVMYIEPWQRYGPGWVKVLVTSVDSIDATTRGVPYAQ
jgi:hypothetical protein